MITFESDRWQSQKLTLRGHAYEGVSVGGEQTSHGFAGYSCVFDLGSSAPMFSTPIANVFISHGHGDHARGLPAHMARRKVWGLDPARYYVPPWMLDAATDFLHAHDDMGEGRSAVRLLEMPRTVGIPVGGNLTVWGFRAHHRIQCLGYALVGERKKLKPEYVGMTGLRIGELKRQGVEVQDCIRTVEIAYCGDTRIDVIAEEPASTAKVLLLECSLIDDLPGKSRKDTIAVCRKAGHVHLDEVIDAYKQGAFDKNEVVLMTHFSSRYSRSQIVQTLRDRLPEGTLGEKFIPLLGGKPLGEEAG
jgi:ribonuclease Z